MGSWVKFINTKRSFATKEFSNSLLKIGLLFLLHPLLLSASNSTGGIGKPLITKFSSETYQGSAMVWRSQFDSRGIHYFAADSVYEYDGKNWSSHHVPIDIILTMSIDSQDDIWIGGVSQLGCLKLRNDGIRYYEDYTAKLPLEIAQNMKEVWHISSSDDGITFVCSDIVLLWDGKEFKYWTQLGNRARLLPSFANGEIFLHSVGGDLLRKINNDFEIVIPAKNLPEGSAIMFMHELEEGKFLAGLHRHGLYILDTNDVGKTLQPFGNLQEDYTFATSVLQIGQYILMGSLMNGLYILDTNEKTILNVGRDDGLPDNCVNDLTLDHRGRIWACTNNGICRFELPQRISFFDGGNDLKTSIHTATYFEDNLYLGTYLGLAKMNFNKENGHTFDLYRDLMMPVYNIIGIDGELVFSDPHFIYRLNQETGSPEKIGTSKSFIYALKNSELAPKSFYKILGQKLELLKLQDGALQTVTSRDLDYKQTSIAESSDGKIWQGVSSADYAYEIRFNEHLPMSFEHARFTQRQFPEVRNKKVRWSKVHIMNGRPLFLTNLGVFTSTEDSAQFKYHDELNLSLSKLSHQTRFTPEGSDAIWVVFRNPDPQGNEHVKSSKQRLGKLWFDENGALKWEKLEVPQINWCGDIHQIYFDRHDTKGTLWLPGTNGIIRLSPYSLQQSENHGVIFRQVSLNGGQYKLDVGKERKISLEEKLRYPINSLKIKFSAPQYKEDVKFMTLLEGLETNWSEPSNLSFAHYNNLSEGDYKFRVIAINSDGEKSKESTYTFAISPPFYRTTFAYVSYIFLGCAFIAFSSLAWTYRLRRKNEELEEIISIKTKERVQAESKAFQAKAEAETKVIAAKLETEAQVLQAIAHDGKNPAHAILGLSAILLNKMEGSEHRKSIRQIHQSAIHLKELQDNFLEAAAISSGGVTLQPEAFNLDELFEDIIDINSHAATSKGIYLRSSPMADSPTLVGDWKRIKQALMNFVSNAIKFTQDGGVTLSADLQPITNNQVKVQLHVSDTGTGIKKEDQEKVFTRFAQLNNQGSTKQKGTGLGLSLTKEVIELMGGNIDITSEYGEGTTFSISLSLSIADEEQKEKINKTDNSALYNFPGKKILVVDDNEINRKVAEQSLVDVGCVVYNAANGEEALQVMLSEDMDLVFMDNEMPRMSGLEATREYRKVEKNPNALPIIGMTGSVKRIQVFLDSGMTDHIAKPFQPPHLYQILKKYLPSNFDKCEKIDFELLGVLCAKEDAPDRIDSAILNSMIDDTTSKLNTHMQHIEKAILNSDAKRLFSEAHKTVSLIKIYGIQSLANTLLNIEDNAKKGEPENLECCKDILPRLKMKFEQFKAQLKSIRTEGIESFVSKESHQQNEQSVKSGT